jgi:predicted nucleic acid-binding protein
MNYLLDSSAWLAHLFDEPGAEQVNLLFDDPQNDIDISALSIPEVYMRLKSLARQTQWQEVWSVYSTLFTKILSTDEAIAHRAIDLRLATMNRLPTVDALIAATAAVHQLTLVHRDPHLAAIPPQHLRQIQLDRS